MSKPDWEYKTITEEEWHRFTAEPACPPPWKTIEEEDFLRIKPPKVSYWKTWLTQLREEDKEQLLIAILEHLEKK